MKTNFITLVGLILIPGSIKAQEETVLKVDNKGMHLGLMEL